MTLDLRRRAIMVNHPEFKRAFQSAFERWRASLDQDAEGNSDVREDSGSSLLDLLIEEMERG